MGASASKRQPVILMLGLDGAGKTTVLYKMVDAPSTPSGCKQQQLATATATNSYNQEKILIGKKTTATVCDLGGSEHMRKHWPMYYKKADGILFVVDSSDHARFDEVKRVIHEVAKETDRLPVLVLANKQDVGGAASAEELAEIFELEELLDGRLWKIEPSSTCYNYGYSFAMKYLKTLINQELSLMVINAWKEAMLL